MRFKTLALLIFSLPSAALAQDSGLATAQRLFEQYQSRERAFDPAAADLYCDSAIIRNTRTYPDDTQRTLELPVAKYKSLVRSTMPLARARGDSSDYFGISYQREGANVRITATRYSRLKQYSSPLSLLVGACEGGSWAVLEELSHSRP